MSLVVETAPAAPRPAVVMPTRSSLQRCVDRQCPPGSCDHDDEREPTAESGHDFARMSVRARGPSGLDITEPEDPTEAEADRVAENLMRSESTGDLGVSASGARGAIQREAETPCAEGKCPEEEGKEGEEVVRPKRQGCPDGSIDVPDPRSFYGGGESLPPEVMSSFETRLGQNFSAVRIHTGDRADRAAGSVGALAYTLGNDIVFARGQYRPDTTDGRRLLAHELTHVIQGSGRPNAEAPALSIDHGRSGPVVQRRTLGRQQADGQRVGSDLDEPGVPHSSGTGGQWATPPPEELEKVQNLAGVSTVIDESAAPAAPPAEGAGAGGIEISASAAEQATVEAASARVETATGSPDTETPAREREPGGAEAVPREQGPLLVDDDAPVVGPNQLRKSAFLDELRVAVCAAADAVLKAAGRSTEGCPLVEQVFAYYWGREASRVERAIHRYARTANRVAVARDYIPAITTRVAASVATWALTGQVTGVPEEVLGPGPGPTGEAEGAAIGGISSEGVGGQAALGYLDRTLPATFSLSSLSSLEAVAHDGSEGPAPDVESAGIRSRLGDGRPLDAGVREPFERALAHDFSGVRIHTGAQADWMAGELRARAFAVGPDVAFASGEFAPGTLTGDAVLAHELAHVAQQGAAPGRQQAPADHTPNGLAIMGNSLEREADAAAVAVVATRDRSGRLARLARAAIPRLRSGLSLQRCPGKPAPAVDASGGPGGATLSRSVTIAPTSTGCGGYDMGAIFSVSGGTAPLNGFVVQRIKFDQRRELCGPGALETFQKDYWEAWEVRAGVVYIGTSTSRHDSDGVGDRFRAPSRPSRKGYQFVEGHAKYIHGYQEPRTWGNETEAGSLPATTKPPKGWTDGGAIDRWIRNDFDCCGGGSTSLTSKS